MISSHMDAFFIVADRLNCLIGLRQPNILSDKWIGKPGYIPKSDKCKAKTANNPDFELGGLVINPFQLPEGFLSEYLPGAKEKWNTDFFKDGKLPPGFSCEEKGPEKGLVKYNGSAIHSDYDLMYVNRIDKFGKKVFMGFAEQNELAVKVQSLLNIYLGIPMIQHGAEMGWKGGVGAAEREMIFSFGPGRAFTSLSSHVPKETQNWH